MSGGHNELPNILYIFSDQHAHDFMGCAGNSAARTPNLDRLAAQGTRFSRAYCPSPVCLPSRMSILTGLRPSEQECWTNNDILDSARPTWLTGLGAVGYRPVLVGRMHSIGPDQLRGYASRPIGDHSSAWPGVARSSMGVLAKTSEPNLVSITRSGAGKSSYQAMDADVLERTVREIEKHIALTPDQPFAITAGFMLPHPPYVANPDDFEEALKNLPPLKIPGPSRYEHSWVAEWRAAKKLGEVSETDIRNARAAYYALVMQLDRQVGTLLDTLDRLGVAEDTIVVYLSDHGDHVGERGLFWKHTLYDESIRVPLIMRWPDRIKAQQIVDQPVEVGGLGQTLLKLINGPKLPNATMPEFTALLAGDPQDSVPVFSEYCVDLSSSWSSGVVSRQRCVILAHHKLIWHDGHPVQLFDLADDPLEVNDLAGEPEYHVIQEKLTKLVLKNWSPVEIKKRMQERAADCALIRQWAENVQPAEPFRWQVSPEQNDLWMPQNE